MCKNEISFKVNLRFNKELITFLTLLDNDNHVLTLIKKVNTASFNYNYHPCLEIKQTIGK